MIILSSPYDPEWVDERNTWILYFLGICIGLGLIGGLEKSLFGITGENLTHGVRQDLMRGILYKQVQWFDREERAPGILTNVLSEDISALNGMTTETISVMIEVSCSLILGLLISSILAWEMALFTVVCSPVMLVGVIAMSRL